MSPAARRRRARGFTLVELLVALSVSLLTVAAAMTLLIQQQRTYALTSGDRAQQESGRLALQDLVGKLKHAGFGVDPNLAFDFGENTAAPDDGAPRSNLKPPATFVKVSSYKCATPVTCRDRVDGADEIVFHARDPWFQRVASSVSTTELELLGELKRPLYQGQILQVSCLANPRTRAYVTVKAIVEASKTPDAPDPAKKVTVTLEDGQQDTGREVFPYENAQLTDGCFAEKKAGLQPVVTAVDRYRYYVAWYLDGVVVPAHTGEARPYLMLDQGLTDDKGDAMLSPVAPDVEDIQFSYLYPPAAAGGPPRLVGATEGVGVGAGAFKLQVDVVAPGMDDLLESAPRLTGHPANIEAVRVSAMVRMPDKDVTLPATEGALAPALANRTTKTDAQPYRKRVTFETTVLLRNLESTYFLYPVVN